MSKQATTKQVVAATPVSTKLVPTVVTESTMGDALFNGVRRRPALCRKPDGTLVVCSSRTARRNGWALVQRAFSRADNRRANQA